MLMNFPDKLFVTFQYVSHVREMYNSLHAEIIYTSPFINAEIKFFSQRSKCQAYASFLIFLCTGLTPQVIWS